jgi:exosortase C (VPDSG-CTERM-specific)
MCFGLPLYELAHFAIGSDLYSHIVLIPFISLYLVWLKRKELVHCPKLDLRWAVLPLVAGFTILLGYWLAVQRGWTPQPEDYLAVMTGSFLILLVSLLLAVFGAQTLRPVAFPLAFLIFMVPFPAIVCDWIESFLQHGSAEAAHMVFKLTGMPVFRTGTEFQLPGFSMEVAPQCSGIHSSLVLFITSLLAGYLLLCSRWSRGTLAALVIPLAMIRNGVRIAILGYLCVRIDPEWINSDLHHRGGPLFFAASLIPFFILLFVLRRFERRKAPN